MSSESTALDDWFECLTGDLLNKLGCQLEKEPCVGKSRPEFLVTTPDNDEFYVEATVVKHRPFSDKPIEADVCEKLNAICTNTGTYWFNAYAEGELSQALSKNALRPIKEWIEGLSATEVNRITQTFSLRNGTFTQDERDLSTGWTVTIIARPRSQAHRGVAAPLLAGIGGGGAVDSAKPLSAAARKKMKQHKGIPGPLLLAVNDFGDFPSERTDVALALFGWEQEAGAGRIRITPSSGKRMPSLWGTGKNSTISAILLFHELTPRTLPYAEVCLYENPQARYPIPSWLRQFFPYAVVEEEQGDQYLRWHPGPRLSSALGIPAQSPPYAELERRLNESAKSFLR